MGRSRIEWTHFTFNPWSGCAKVSPGCRFCYADALPPVMRRHAVWGEGKPRVPASESYWKAPLSWNQEAVESGTRLRVFCASTADVMEDRDDLDPLRARLWELIRATPGLDWLVLTKRPQKMVRWAEAHGWPVNAWAGTSVENQEAAEERISVLLQVPGPVVRFLSMEPLLGLVSIAPWLQDLSWVIVGGESGRNARPMHPAWVRAIREEAVSRGVPFFFKQWGEWAPDLGVGWTRGTRAVAALGDGTISEMVEDYFLDGPAQLLSRLGKKEAGRLLDGRTWDEFPRVTR